MVIWTTRKQIWMAVMKAWNYHDVMRSRICIFLRHDIMAITGWDRRCGCSIEPDHDYNTFLGAEGLRLSRQVALQNGSNFLIAYSSMNQSPRQDSMTDGARDASSLGSSISAQPKVLRPSSSPSSSSIVSNFSYTRLPSSSYLLGGRSRGAS